MNELLSIEILKKVVRAGIDEFCVCPGGRAAALVILLNKLPGLKKWWHFEDRSAGFFALGRAKALGRPVAVIVTSGTAVGNLLPAAMEADRTHVPLLLITADFPRERNSIGGLQWARQVGLFGSYAEACIDLDPASKLDLSSWSRSRPLHVNARFDIPPFHNPPLEEELFAKHKDEFAVHSVPAPSSRVDPREMDVLETFLKKTQRPLVVVSGLSPVDQQATIDFLERLAAPVYVETTAGVREEARLQAIRLNLGRGVLQRAARNGYEIDGVLRIGTVPVAPLWSEVESSKGKVPALSICRETALGIKGGALITAEIGDFLGAYLPRVPSGGGLEAAKDFLAADRSLAMEISKLLDLEPRADATLVRELSKRIPAGARFFIGNSLPLRIWDGFASFETRYESVGANRGINGIDGQVSTFFGYCGEDTENWGFLGDLTTLYDLSAPWILSQMPASISATLVVFNNHGGRTFRYLLPQPEFQHEHSIGFPHWAAMWGLRYEAWDRIPDRVAAKGTRIVELLPDHDASLRLMDAVAKAYTKN